jgi:uncharacterized protein with LGFP repeats
MSAILEKHMVLGGFIGWLGLPISEELTCADGEGRFQNFEHGSIYWHPDVGAYEVHGTIRDKWIALGAEATGGLGYPKTDERITPDGIGRFSWFTGGLICWHPDMGAWELHGAILIKWLSLGGVRSHLGYPRTDEMGTPDGAGRYNHFQHGSIYFTTGTGAHEVRGAIHAKWESLNWETGPLGYPTTDEYPTVDGVGRSSRFQKGGIIWSSTSGASIVP